MSEKDSKGNIEKSEGNIKNGEENIENEKDSKEVTELKNKCKDYLCVIKRLHEMSYEQYFGPYVIAGNLSKKGYCPSCFMKKKRCKCDGSSKIFDEETEDSDKEND